MSAELLRKAAEAMRSGDEWPLDAEAFAFAVADLLERVADNWAIAALGYWSVDAAAVAHAYLGRDA